MFVNRVIGGRQLYHGSVNFFTGLHFLLQFREYISCTPCSPRKNIMGSTVIVEKQNNIKFPSNRWLPVQGRWMWGQCGGPVGSSRGWTLSIGRRILRFWSPKNQNSILFCYLGVYLSKDVSSSLVFRDTVHIFHRLQSSLHDINLNII